MLFKLRMRKVNELVREVVADAVTDLKDPRIGFLTITGAETSPDLRHAVVYYSVLGSEDEKADTAAALGSAKSRIQGVLGRETRRGAAGHFCWRHRCRLDEGLRINQILADLEDAEEHDDI